MHRGAQKRVNTLCNTNKLSSRHDALRTCWQTSMHGHPFVEDSGRFNAQKPERRPLMLSNYMLRTISAYEANACRTRLSANRFSVAWKMEFNLIFVFRFPKTFKKTVQFLAFENGFFGKNEEASLRNICLQTLKSMVNKQRVRAIPVFELAPDREIRNSF